MTSTNEEKVRILTPNFIDRYSVISATYGGDTDPLWDRDPDSQFKSPSGNRDDYDVVIDIAFKDASGAALTVKLNAFIMLNHNIRKFYLEKFTSSGMVTIFDRDDVTEEDSCFTFGAHDVTQVRLHLLQTIQPNKVKTVGELILARNRFILPAPSAINMNWREDVAKNTLGDGSLHKAYTRFAPNRTQRYGANVEWNLLPRESYEQMLCLKNEGAPFLWYPESDFSPRDIWLVNWVNSFQPKYTYQNKNAGYTLLAELQEV